MDRRRFLALIGLGAAGGVAGAQFIESSTPTAASPEPTNALDTVPPGETSGLQRVVWSVDTSEPKVALTFDDGPDPEFTPRILGVLDRHDVRATFMVMGYNAVQHPKLLREIVMAGHEIGGHGWSHRNLAETSAEETVAEIERGIRAIEERTGVRVKMFRPPYGRFNETTVRVLAASRRDLIIWSVTRGKLAWKEPKQIASHVVDSIGPGSIIDLHDGIGRGTFNRSGPSAARLRRRREVEIAALPQMIEGVKARHLSFETLSGLLAAWRKDASEA